jgi:DNA primase
VTASEFAERYNAKRSGNNWMMKCPAHDDRSASLSIREGNGGCVLLHCFAGCTLDAILSALELSKRDLFPDEMRKFASTTNSQQSKSESKRRTFSTLDYAIACERLRLLNLLGPNVRETRRDWYHDAEGNDRFVVVRFDSDEKKT